MKIRQNADGPSDEYKKFTAPASENPTELTLPSKDQTKNKVEDNRKVGDDGKGNFKKVERRGK